MLLYHWGGSCLLPSSNHWLLDLANVPDLLSSEFLYYGENTRHGVREIHSGPDSVASALYDFAKVSPAL